MPAAKELVIEVVRGAVRNRIKDLAAQLAFWALLAIFPFMIFLLTIIGYVPLHGLDREVLEFANRVMPDPVAHLFERTVRDILARQRGWLLVVSVLGAIWSASGGIASAMRALNLAYEVKETRPWWRLRLVSMCLIIGATAAIIVATTGLIIGPEIVHLLEQWTGLGAGFALLWRWVRWPIVVLDLLFMLAGLYYFLPNVRRRFRLFTPGAAIAVALWVVASLGFKIYVRHFHSFSRTYGALGTAVLLLVWLYLSSFVVLLGGEINAVWDRLRTERAAPTQSPSESAPPSPAPSPPKVDSSAEPKPA
ncbi:MAG: YihY/virulence factor BrkB family protein [Polyangia bacterium]|jgi:membrane protein